MSTSDFAEAWLSGPQGTKFYTRTYAAAAPSAVLVFVHGFNEHIGRYTHIHPRFAQRGITVFTYDQRGFGRTALDDARSKDSALGKTSWPEQLADIEWAVRHAHAAFPALPVYLMGHSMGGGLVLGFATRQGVPPTKESVALLSGIIGASPLIEQAKPASKILRWLGGKAGLVKPYMLIPADVNPDDLSHDAACNEAYKKDPLIKTVGSLRNVSDMLNGGEQLLATNYQYWPENLPVFLIHGDQDKVTSAPATEAFYKKVPAKDKKHSVYPGGFHELLNEPDQVKEKVADEVIAWIEAHLPREADASKL